MSYSDQQRSPVEGLGLWLRDYNHASTIANRSQRILWALGRALSGSMGEEAFRRAVTEAYGDHAATVFDVVAQQEAPELVTSAPPGETRLDRLARKTGEEIEASVWAVEMAERFKAYASDWMYEAQEEIPTLQAWANWAVEFIDAPERVLCDCIRSARWRPEPPEENERRMKLLQILLERIEKTETNDQQKGAQKDDL